MSSTWLATSHRRKIGITEQELLQESILSTTSGEAHGWQHHIGEKWHNRATTSGGEYSITTQDGRVRPKHVLIEFKK
jgi:hypothetical protein